MSIAKPLQFALPLLLLGCNFGSQDPSDAMSTPALVQAKARAESRESIETCRDLDACVARLRFLALKADELHGLDRYERALIERIITFEDAPARLVSLLADPDRNVAELAAAALGDVPNLDPLYLPQVKAGLDRKLAWLPRALGRMDSDEAAREAVERYLVSEGAPDNQENFAVQLSGKRAIKWIVRRARCQPACGKDDIFLLSAALRSMGHERAVAGSPLMDLAEAQSSSTEVAQGALRLVAALETDAAALEPRLLALARKRPELGHGVELALIETRSERAGELLARSLGPDSDPIDLRDIAVLGRAGYSAGPKVLELLQAQDWELRIAAATALGEIGYTPAAEALVRAAQDSSDVRLQWVAVRALARLRAAAAGPVLEQLSRGHWYPPVREAAASALQELSSPLPAADDDHAVRRGINRFWAWWQMGSTAPACSRAAVKERETTGILDGSSDAERIQLESLAYAKPERIPPPLPQAGAESPEPIDSTPAEMKVPGVALRLENGWLLGSDDGEWGGELVFVDDAGRAKVIANRNIQGLQRLGSRVIVLSGLAHLSSNSGALYELVRLGPGWELRTWRGLPAAPGRGAMTDSGELLLETYGGGTLLVTPEGAMRMAPCAR